MYFARKQLMISARYVLFIFKKEFQFCYSSQQSLINVQLLTGKKYDIIYLGIW